jgi:hypothetical protein
METVTICVKSLNGTNLYSGVKFGVINRASVYPIFAIEGGVMFRISDTVGFGFRGSYDARGDSAFYQGDKWVWNTQANLQIQL